MSLDVDTKVEDGYLLVTVSGSHDLEVAKGLFGRVFSECVRHKLTGILFDVRKLEGDIPLVDRYAFGEFLGSQQQPAIRMSFLASEAQFWSDKFLETVAVNRGAAVRTTMDPVKARDWAMGSETAG